MIGPTTNKAGMPFSSFFLKDEGILVIVEKFSLKSFILVLVKRAFLIFELGFRVTIGF